MTAPEASTIETIVENSWRLDHIGHAVWNIEEGIKLYSELYNAALESRESLSEEGVEVAFLKYDNCLIELIAPSSSKPNQALEKFLNKRGPGMHHICFAVDCVSEELKRLSAKGVRLIDSTPRSGSRGLNVAFIHPSSSLGALIELCSHK